MGDHRADECFYPLWAAVGCGLRDKPPTRYRQNRPAPGTAFFFQRRVMANGLTRLKPLAILERGESCRSLKMPREMTLVIKPALAGNLRQTQIAALKQMPDPVSYTHLTLPTILRV